MLEYAVRPYQTPNSQGKIIIPSTPTATTERAVLTWGATGSVPQAQTTGSNVVCCSEQLEELTREGALIRIFGNKPDNYVDVFRSSKLTHKRKSNQNNHPCDSPLDQMLGQEFGLDDGGDVTIDLGFAGTETHDDHCKVTWSLNNNTTAA